MLKMGGWIGCGSGLGVVIINTTFQFLDIYKYKLVAN